MIHARLASLDKYATRREKEGHDKSERLVDRSSECCTPDSIDKAPNKHDRESSNDVALDALRADASGGSFRESSPPRQTLVSGPAMDLSGFASLNAAAFVLQHCRFDHGVAGVVDAATGAVERYSELYRSVQRVSVGLRERGFRPGSAMRFGPQSTSPELLVLALSVWNLLGTIELDDSTGNDVEDTGYRNETTTHTAGQQSGWLVCDSEGDAPQQLARLQWGPEKVIVVRPDMRTRSSEFVSYDDLLSSQTAEVIDFGQVRTCTGLAKLGTLAHALNRHTHA